MSISEFENMDINEELEFNNGVGDALKQKESYTFSWKKTAIVLSLGVVVIFLVTFGVLELGKNALNINQESDIELDIPLVMQSLNQAQPTGTFYLKIKRLKLLSLIMKVTLPQSKLNLRLFRRLLLKKLHQKLRLYRWLIKQRKMLFIVSLQAVLLMLTMQIQNCKKSKPKGLMAMYGH